MGHYRIRDPYAEPTPGQRRKARELGIDVPAGIKKGALSDLIDGFIQSRLPTDEQLTFAAALDITVPPEMTSVELDAMLDRVVRERSIQAMKENPDLRAGKIIMYKGMPYTIESVGNMRGRYVAELHPLRVMMGRFDRDHPKPRYYQVKRVHIITIADVTAVTRDQLDQFMLSFFYGTD
ncbi:MAG TPA: hypothetical protein VFT16_03595 [Candidatus Saccharimonadales bacterium]|nr:hypothetical protein [Candidatus Saccharimonadales bacterium]